MVGQKSTVVGANAAVGVSLAVAVVRATKWVDICAKVVMGRHFRRQPSHVGGAICRCGRRGVCSLWGVSWSFGLRTVRPNAGRTETELHMGIEEVLPMLWRQSSGGRLQRQCGVFFLWPDLSPFIIAPQPPRRSGQIRSGDDSVKCGGNRDGSDAFTTLGNDDNVSASDTGKPRRSDANGQCVCSERWGRRREVFPSDFAGESGV